jgi:hypothetical protein
MPQSFAFAAPLPTLPAPFPRTFPARARELFLLPQPDSLSPSQTLYEVFFRLDGAGFPADVVAFRLHTSFDGQQLLLPRGDLWYLRLGSENWVLEAAPVTELPPDHPLRHWPENELPRWLIYPMPLQALGRLLEYCSSLSQVNPADPPPALVQRALANFGVVSSRHSSLRVMMIGVEGLFQTADPASVWSGLQSRLAVPVKRLTASLQLDPNQQVEAGEILAEVVKVSLQH